VFDLVTSVGGVQNVMTQLLPRLAERFEVAVIDAYRNPEYARMLSGTAIERVELGSAPERRFIGGAGRAGRALNVARRAPWLAATGLRLRRWVGARRPAALWFNQLPSVSLFPRFLPRHVPVVFHAHGFSSAADIHGGPRIAGRCARVVAVSQAVARIVRAAGMDAARVTVVHNGVDPGELARRARLPAAPLPARAPGQVVLAHVAVIGAHKQQHVAIEALARLPRHAVLWLCGGVPDGGGRAYAAGLEALAVRLGVRDRVSFLGWRSDVAAVLAAADVALLPSVQESFGMVLAEAMALGKPCVGAAVGGIPEVIEHGVTGFVADPEPLAFAAALGTLTTSADARRAMGEAGRRRVERLFTLERQARRFADVLDAVVARTAANVRGAGATAGSVAEGGAR
jgi:glycosyltransferase involved in cell wall biosynthesis